ncbi:hypothetical protein QYW47_20375, partial [Xanthomonas campestris]|uniref:hypothetical protein n=1 Tax=Xanthomonas campestris TaxID=339 RepID=UPI002B22B39E
ARTFFQAITSQVIDLTGGNVGKPQHPKYFRESDRQQLGKSFAKPIQQSVRDPTVSKIKKSPRGFYDRSITHSTHP